MTVSPSKYELNWTQNR
ncbi:MAG: hypothetical protein MUP24_11125 [Gillisia sp.]|nr:hypothetical protein [Gillisia sp.]